MDHKTALDLVRAYHGRIVKPFEKLGEGLEVAAQVAQRLQALHHEVAEQERAIAEGRGVLARLPEEVRQAEIAARARIAAATATATAMEQKAHAAAQRHEQQITEQQAALVTRQQEADAEFSAQERERTGIIADLEQRITGLQEDFKRLRERLAV